MGETASSPANDFTVSAAASAASAGGGPYISPVVQVEPLSGLAVLYLRNGDTGEVEAQIPSQKVVQQYMSHVLPETTGNSEQKKAVADGAPTGNAAQTGEGNAAAVPSPGGAESTAAGSPVGGGLFGGDNSSQV